MLSIWGYRLNTFKFKCKQSKKSRGICLYLATVIGLSPWNKKKSKNSHSLLSSQKLISRMKNSNNKQLEKKIHYKDIKEDYWEWHKNSEIMETGWLKTGHQQRGCLQTMRDKYICNSKGLQSPLYRTCYSINKMIRQGGLVQVRKMWTLTDSRGFFQHKGG